MTELPPKLVAYRSQLKAAIERDLARPAERQAGFIRRGLPARLLTSTAAVGVAAAMLVLALVGSGAPQPAIAAVLGRLETRLSQPPDTILHERALVTIGRHPPTAFELWRLNGTNPEYRVIKGSSDTAYNGSSYSSYDPATNTIRQWPNAEPLPPLHDPTVLLREMISAGTAHLVGTAELAGKPVYELAISGAQDPFLNGRAYVTTDDYTPVLIQTSVDIPCGSSTCTTPESVSFSTYEHLAASPTNLRLLDLPAQHPTAQVIAATDSPPNTTTKQSAQLRQASGRS
jgi:hypothetical protein